MDNILILGAKGFLGQAFQTSSLFKSAIFSNEKILTQEELFTLCDHYSIQTIINCAAKGVYSQDAKEDIFLTNILLVHWILEWLKKKDEGHYVHFGSWFENAKDLHTDYAISKREASKKIAALEFSIRKRILHIELSHVYGYGEKSTRLIPSIIESIKHSRELTLLNPHRKLQMLWREDIPRFVSACHPSDSIIHLNGDGPYSISEIYDLAKKVIQNPISSSDSKTKEGFTTLSEGLKLLAVGPQNQHSCSR